MSFTQNAFDRIIIGGGLYGLYSAEISARSNKDQKILLVERDPKPFQRATYINQARVHMGYHYPRSISTAIKSAHYFNRFMDDYGFCVLKDFKQVYATASKFSWTNKAQFVKFCTAANIPCTEINNDIYFNPNQCDGAFETKEYTYDAMLLKDYLLKKLASYSNISLMFGTEVIGAKKVGSKYWITLSNHQNLETEFLLNATYASSNQISSMLGYELFKIKYELCEIILCNVGKQLEDIGITVMDGPFFSIMPFGKTGLHSLTSVTFTPHKTSYNEIPTFDCQNESKGYCSCNSLNNCNECIAKPATAWAYMSKLAQKYLKSEYQFQYYQSLFSMKPILKTSEIDDSRPTVIKTFTQNPTYISVLSGKINTVYDLDEVLK